MTLQSIYLGQKVLNSHLNMEINFKILKKKRENLISMSYNKKIISNMYFETLNFAQKDNCNLKRLYSDTTGR